MVRIALVLDANDEALEPLFSYERRDAITYGTPASTNYTPAMPHQNPPAAPSQLTALKDMFARFDVLCEALGDTLLEVVVALGRSHANADARDRVEMQENAKLWDVLRGSMPRMVGRRCLAVRRHESSVNVHFLARVVFESYTWHWRDIQGPS